MKRRPTYPEYFPSRKIKRFLGSLPELPSPPIEPEKPTVETDPGEYDSGGNRGCSLFLLIAAIIGFFAIMSSDMENKGGLILPGIGVIVMLFIMFKSTSWDKESNERQRMAHKESLSTLPERKAKYEKEYAAYLERKEEYDEIKQERLSDGFVSNYRKQLIEKWIEERDIPEFKDYDEDDEIKKGPAVNFFYNDIFAITDMYINKKIPVGKKYYYPDILIEFGGLYVVVEIDEPYAGNEGTPIHYIEENLVTFKSVDKDRNDYLTDMGFEVVRFSEEQIFLHIDGCINYLFSLLKHIMLGDSNVEVDDKIKTLKWTKEEANKMAYKRFRNSYVPAKYHDMIDKEDRRSYEEFRDEFN